MATPDQFAEAKARAQSTIQDTWRHISTKYTLGWGGPLEAIEDAFPHVAVPIWDIRDRISADLPFCLFQTRQSPPVEMVIAVPFWKDSGNPYNCRLVPSRPLDPRMQHLLGMFAQSFWFAIEQRMLPGPWAGDALQRAMLSWTGPEFFE